VRRLNLPETVRVGLGWFLAAAVLGMGSPLLPLANSPSSGSDRAPVRIPSLVAWNEETIAAASSGDAFRGLLIATRCNHCHGNEGFSANSATPNLAAMDRLSIWKQLDDFRSGKRNSPLMKAIAASLSAQNSADVAAYYSMLPTLPDLLDNRAFPQAVANPASADTSLRLIGEGDVRRGIPPCQACHGPVAYVRGAPSLSTQNSGYILSQLEAFRDGRRSNDINMVMRSIARLMTDNERQAIAESYGAGHAFPK
jgi:cytochrome c553